MRHRERRNSIAASEAARHPMPETSRSLLERLRTQPDDAAWARLVDVYTPMIRYWLGTQGLACADADDLTQEILMVVVASCPVSVIPGGRRFSQLAADDQRPSRARLPASPADRPRPGGTTPSSLHSRTHRAQSRGAGTRSTTDLWRSGCWS